MFEVINQIISQKMGEDEDILFNFNRADVLEGKINNAKLYWQFFFQSSVGSDTFPYFGELNIISIIPSSHLRQSRRGILRNRRSLKTEGNSKKGDKR